MQAEQIDNYFRLLEKDGWIYNRYRQEEGQTDWWLARHKIAGDRIHIYLHVGQSYLQWQAPLQVALVAGCREALARYLLHLNYELKLVKFSLDSRDQVHLTAEILLAGSGFATFKGVLNALHTYYEQYRREISLIASNTELAQAWLSLSPLEDEPDIIFVADEGAMG